MTARLFRILDSRKIDQHVLATKLGRCNNTISRWRCGHTTPTIMDVEAIAQVLGFELGLREVPKRG